MSDQPPVRPLQTLNNLDDQNLARRPVQPLDELEEQTCKICRNYLSVGPVRNLLEKGHVCGRCVGNYAYLESAPSRFDEVAANFDFRCVNFFGGCRTVLRFNEAREHERTCRVPPLACPLPKCLFKANGCQLLQHLKGGHDAIITESGTFELEMKNERAVVYVKGTELLLLYICFRETHAYVHNTMITGKSDSNVQCKLTFFKEGGPFKIQTPRFQINDVQIREQGIHQMLKAPVSNSEVYTQYKYCFRFNVGQLKTYFEESCSCQVETIGEIYDFFDNEIKPLRAPEPAREVRAAAPNPERTAERIARQMSDMLLHTRAEAVRSGVLFNNGTQEIRVAPNHALDADRRAIGSRELRDLYQELRAESTRDVQQRGDCCCIV